MDQQDPNPYQAPPAVAPQHPGLPEIPPADLKKIEAIVKDAGQFWLAIIICILCTGIGSLIVPIWYGVRLVQWGRFSGAYPFLMDANAAPGSLAQKFTASRWKLIVGLVFGLMMIGLVFLYILLVAVVGVSSTVQQI